MCARVRRVSFQPARPRPQVWEVIGRATVIHQGSWSGTRLAAAVVARSARNRACPSRRLLLPADIELLLCRRSSARILHCCFMI